MSYFISINKEESSTLSQIHNNPLCKTPDNQSLRYKALNRFFSAPTTARITLSDKLPELKPKKVVLYWNDKAVIAYVNGSAVWIAIPSIILVCLLSSRWTFITQKRLTGDLPPRKGFVQKNGIPNSR